MRLLKSSHPAAPGSSRLRHRIAPHLPEAFQKSSKSSKPAASLATFATFRRIPDLLPVIIFVGRYHRSLNCLSLQKVAQPRIRTTVMRFDQLSARETHSVVPIGPEIF